MKISKQAAVTLLAGLALSGLAMAQQKLTIWLVGDDLGPKVLQPAVDAFKVRNPKVTVEVQAIPWSDAFTKYLAAIASRTGPDIITGGLSFGIELGNKGGMINLKEKYPAFAEQVAKTAQPGVLRSITAVDGSLYAVPYDLTVQLMYYRKDLVTKAPKTWDEFAKAIEKERAAGRKGFAQQWGNAGWLGYFPYLYQAGGRLYDEKCTRATVASAEGVKALQFYAGLYTKYKAPTDGWPDMEQGMESGDYAMGMTGNWALLGIPASRPNLKGKWEAAVLPAGPSGKSTAFIGGSVMGVMAYTKVPDLAVSFIQTVYAATVTKNLVDAAGKLGNLWLPGGRTDMTSLVNISTGKGALLAQLKDAEGPPNCPGWEQSGDALQKAIQTVIFNNTDPKAALDAAAATMNENLVKYK